jgi:hypothetical protein
MTLEMSGRRGRGNEEGREGKKEGSGRRRERMKEGIRREGGWPRQFVESGGDIAEISKRPAG